MCASCGLGLLLEAREDAVPTNRDAFLVVDSALLVQAMSAQAETFLGVTEEQAIDKPVAELLVPADAEAQGRGGFASAIAEAAERPGPRAHAALRAAVEHVRRPDAGADRDLRAAAGRADRAREQRHAPAARRRVSLAAPAANRRVSLAAPLRWRQLGRRAKRDQPLGQHSNT